MTDARDLSQEKAELSQKYPGKCAAYYVRADSDRWFQSFLFFFWSEKGVNPRDDEIARSNRMCPDIWGVQEIKAISGNLTSFVGEKIRNLYIPEHQ